MLDFALKDNDLEFKNGDFVIESSVNQEITNLVSNWLQTNIKSYALDPSLGVDIYQMERIKTETLMLYFINQQLSFFLENKLVLNFRIQNFLVRPNTKTTSFKLIVNTNDSQTSIDIISGE